MTAQGKAVYETWRAAVPDIACNVPGGPWEDLPATVRAGFEALTPPGHLLVMRGTIALRDAEIELLRKRHEEFVSEITGALLQALGADSDTEPEAGEPPERRALRIAAYLGERVDELHGLIAEAAPEP